MSVKAPSPYFLGLSPGQTRLLSQVYYGLLSYPAAGVPAQYEAGDLELSDAPGMSFMFTTEVPSEFATEGLGTSELVQIINETDYDMTVNGHSGTAVYHTGAIRELDNGLPYGYNGGPFPCDGTGHISADGPSVDLEQGSAYTTSIWSNDVFDMFLVFTPPMRTSGWSVISVPLQEHKWSWASSDQVSPIQLIWNAPQGDPSEISSRNFPYSTYLWDTIAFNGPVTFTWQ